MGFHGRLIHTCPTFCSPAKRVPGELPYGDYTLTARVASKNMELDRGNNEADHDVAVVFRAPDLQFSEEDIQLIDPNPDDTGELVVTVTVHNDGHHLKHARDVRVQLWDRGIPVATETLAIVESGASVEAVLAYTIEGVGPRELQVRVDPGNAVVELDEEDNDASFSVVVGKVKVDLQMSKQEYGLTEMAKGMITVTFNQTGKPLPRHDVVVPISYSGLEEAGLFDIPIHVESGTLVAVDVCQDLHASVDAKQVFTLTDGLAGEATKLVDPNHIRIELSALLHTSGLLSSFDPADGNGLARLYTLHLRTNNAGQVSFQVPLAGLKTLNDPAGIALVTGAVSAEACATVVVPSAPALDVAGLIPEALDLPLNTYCITTDPVGTNNRGNGLCVTEKTETIVNEQLATVGALGEAPDSHLLAVPVPLLMGTLASKPFAHSPVSAVTPFLGAVVADPAGDVVEALPAPVPCVVGQVLPEDVAALLPAVPSVTVPSQVTVGVSTSQPIPALPVLANLPGDYGAAAFTDWYGYGTYDRETYQHVVTNADVVKLQEDALAQLAALGVVLPPEPDLSSPEGALVYAQAVLALYGVEAPAVWLPPTLPDPTDPLSVQAFAIALLEGNGVDVPEGGSDCIGTGLV